jgi:hypothetical protein
MSDFSLNSLDRLALGQEAKGQAKSLGQLKPDTEEDIGIQKSVKKILFPWI